MGDSTVIRLKVSVAMQPECHLLHLVWTYERPQSLSDNTCEV